MMFINALKLNKFMLSLVYTKFFFFFFYFGPPYFQTLVPSLIIIVGELGVLIEYASRVMDPRPNKKTRWFDVPCPDHILKERRLEKGNEGLIGKWSLSFTEES